MKSRPFMSGHTTKVIVGLLLLGLAAATARVTLGQRNGPRRSEEAGQAREGQRALALL